MFLFGLAAAAMRKPTVAQYTRYLSHLQTGVFANGAGFYGDALHRPAIAVHNSFPEKSTSGGVNSTYSPLKRRDLLSRSFPKMLLLGKVRFSARSLTANALPVGFGFAAAANPLWENIVWRVVVNVVSSDTVDKRAEAADEDAAALGGGRVAVDAAVAVQGDHAAAVGADALGEDATALGGSGVVVDAAVAVQGHPAAADAAKA